MTSAFASEPDATPDEAAAIAAVLAGVAPVETSGASRSLPAWRRAALREGIEGNAAARGTQI